MSSLSTFECFGLVIHGYSADEALRRIDESIRHGVASLVVTANPEILLEAKHNPAYWQVLRQAELRLVDSIGLQLAGVLKGARPTRVPGVSFAERLLQESAVRGWNVAIIGGDEGNADKAAWHIRASYPNLSILAERGGSVNQDGSDDDAGASMRFRLTQFAPDVLLVGFGHPKQESWIAKYLTEFPTVKVAVGIGGTIDYWSGTKKRAPRIFQSLGLEWLFRLFNEPKRWRRIARAVIVFPMAVFREMFLTSTKEK